MNRTLALSFVLSGCLVGSGNDKSSTDIIGGSDDAGDPAVALLRGTLPDGTGFGCTATLIDNGVLLTAGHCADPTAVFDVSFDAQPDLAAPYASSGYIAADVIANPAYDGNGADGHDVSIVLLAGSAPVAPIGLGAAPAAGGSVRAVGYGMNVFGDDGTGIGTRRQLDTAVDAVAAHEIVVGVDGASTCHGDSGGPIFDASGLLVATVSYGDTADCHGSSHDMRVDDNLDFIQQFIGGTGSGSGSGGGGNSCQVSQNGLSIQCTDGNCTCSVDGNVVSTCTASDPSSACSNGNCCGF